MSFRFVLNYRSVYKRIEFISLFYIFYLHTFYILSVRSYYIIKHCHLVVCLMNIHKVVVSGSSNQVWLVSNTNMCAEDNGIAICSSSNVIQLSTLHVLLVTFGT